MQNPQWLRSFTLLAQLRSFTRTAERLGITQAAVSQHIRGLEAEHGPLLIRTPRQIDLTPAGEILLEYARQVDWADRLLKHRLSSRDSEAGGISLITPASIGLFLYPLLLELQEANRGLNIYHRLAPDHEVFDALVNNRYEMGLTTVRPNDSRLTSSQFTEEHLELVAPADAKLETWSDLEQLGFIDHPDGQAMATRLLGRYFPGNPGISTISFHGFSNRVDLILEPVSRGLGFTVMPRHAREIFANADSIRVVARGSPVIDTLWLLHRSEWPLSSRNARVVSYLKERAVALKRGEAEAGRRRHRRADG